MFSFLKKEKQLINSSALSTLSEPYKDSIVFFCGFAFMPGGSPLARGRYKKRQSLLVLKEQSITLIALDGTSQTFAIAEYSVYTDSNEIIFGVGNDVISCFDFLTLDELSQYNGREISVLDQIEASVSINLQRIEEILLQNGGKKIQVQEQS